MHFQKAHSPLREMVHVEITVPCIMVNNHHANSTVKQCKSAGCPVTVGSSAAKALAEMDKEHKYLIDRATN